MTERQITRFIDVAIAKDSPQVAAASFGYLMVVSDYAYLSTTKRIKEFTSDTSVGAFFGTSSEEYKVANAFFNQDPFLEDRPESIFFGRFADADTAALLETGDSSQSGLAVWQAITDGEFAITIDGTLDEPAALDFSSAASMADVATVITTGLTQGTCLWRDGRFVFVSPTTGASSTITLLDTVATPAGTDISGTGFLDGDIAKSPTNLGGSVLSQGQVAETFADAITAIENIDNSWYAMGVVKKYRDTSTIQDMADEIESRRKMFLSATNDTNVLVLGNTSTNSYYVKNANYRRTGFIYHDNSTLYPDIAWMGLQLPKAVGSTNWAFKSLPGIAEGASVDIPAVALTEDEIDAAYDVNTNVYTSILSSAFTHQGVMGGGRTAVNTGGGEYIDIIRNIDFLQARVEEGLLSLLIEREIVPMTDAGIAICDNRLKDRLNTYGVDQGILIAGSVVTSFPKRSEISSEDRGNRLLPDGQFQGELVGGINKVIVRGTVYI